MPHHWPPISTNPSPKRPAYRIPVHITQFSMLRFRTDSEKQRAKRRCHTRLYEYINTNNARSWHFDKWYCGWVDKNSEQKASYIRNATYFCFKIFFFLLQEPTKNSKVNVMLRLSLEPWIAVTLGQQLGQVETIYIDIDIDTDLLQIYTWAHCWSSNVVCGFRFELGWVRLGA